MKHFGVYAILSVMLIALFGGFAFPEKTFAAVTPADYEALKAHGNEIDFYSKTVPTEGFGQSYLYFMGSTIVGTATNLNPTAFLTSLASQAIYTENSYFKEAYVGILIDTYNSTKDVSGTTRNSLELSTFTRYNTFLGDIIFSETIQTQPTESGSARRSATMRERQQAYVIWQFAKTRQTIALAKVNEDAGRITQAEREAVTRAASDEQARTTINAIQTMGPAAVPTISKEMTCGGLFEWTVIGCINAGLTWLVKNVLLEFVGFFLWVSANLLNYSMYHGVFKFKDFAPNEIYAIWLVIRQIVSLFVFFAGLFIGFMAIIGKSEEFKKYIAFLVVFGLFVNFSYPIVRVFVDVSNVVSLQIYQTTMGDSILAENSNDSAGARIMTKMGLQQLALSATAADGGTGNGKVGFAKDISSLPGALAAVVFVGFAAYVLFMAAFLLIARTALLVCIIIASPILLVDTVVPALGEKAQWLRGMFISQLFVAPVFTIMLALTLKFLDIFSHTAGNPLNGASSALNASASASSATVFFNLVMMIVMLFIMLKVTKAVAGGVGETVTKWAGKAGGLGVGLTTRAAFAGVGFAGRNTLGKAGEYLGQQGGVIGDLGRKMSSAKYDLRNLGGVKAGASMLGISGMGQGIDKNRKELADAREDEIVKNAEKIADKDERETYLQRKLNYRPFGAFGKAGPSTDQYERASRQLERGDDEMTSKYINASDKERQVMRDDRNNKKFGDRFANIDKYYDKKNPLTDTEKDNLAKAMGEAAEKAFNKKKDRESNLLEAYLNATDRQKALMRSDDRNSEALKKRFEDADRYTSAKDQATKNAILSGVKTSEDQRTLQAYSVAKEKEVQQKIAQEHDRIASIITADAVATEKILAEATAANDQALINQIGVVRKLKELPAGSVEQQTVELGQLDPALARKVVAYDKLRLDNDTKQKAQEAIVQQQTQVVQTQIDSLKALTDKTQESVDIQNDVKDILARVMAGRATT